METHSMSLRERLRLVSKCLELGLAIFGPRETERAAGVDRAVAQSLAAIDRRQQRN
jgi:hypothetical protein